MLYNEVDDWKERLGWIREKDKYVTRNTNYEVWTEIFDGYERKLKRIEKDLDDMKFVIGKAESNRIVKKSEDGMEDIAIDLTAARDKMIYL